MNDKTPFAILPGAYTFSAAGSLGNTDAPLFGYTATGKRIQLFRIFRNLKNPKYSFTVTEPITSVYFISNAADSNTGTISSIQLERNSTATEYKPHTSQTLAFALPQEHPYLAKLPDGTADEITVDRDGNVELVARVAKAKVPDNVKWTLQSNGSYSLAYSGVTLTVNGLKKMRAMQLFARSIKLRQLLRMCRASGLLKCCGLCHVQTLTTSLLRNAQKLQKE